MNIHPLFVHFPIGLLVVYCLLELVRFKKFLNSSNFRFLKGFLSITGLLAAGGAVITGYLAKEIISPTIEVSRLIETHETFAQMTFLIFSILAGAYFVYFIGISNYSKLIPKFLYSIAHFIRESWLTPLIALLGLILITITGGLGAAIVYGPNIDPFVKAIYSLFL
jgi:uncharacterized membrane protein